MATMLLERLRPLLDRFKALPRTIRLMLAVAALLLAILIAIGPEIAVAVLLGVAVGVALKAGPDADASSSRDVAAATAVQPLPDLPPRAAPATSTVWRAMVDALPDPVIAVDRDDLVIHANQAAHDIFPALRHGRPIALATRSPEFADALAQALEDRMPRTVGLLERVPVERRLDAAISPVAGAGPELPAVLVVLHDISERDRLAQMRADFIAHASHELRTPLTALRGFIETLQGPAKNDAAGRERFLAIMAAEAMRMTRILDDLLSLARVEMRAHIAPTDHVDIAEVVSEVVKTLEPLAVAAKITVSIEKPPGGRLVRADRDEIMQVFINLVQNAIKYGRSGGVVQIRLTDVGRPDRSAVAVAVVDNGPGIAEQHIPRLTERFYRVDDKSSREKGGTGLGLAIVKHILNRHQGVLKIESELGHGSKFTVELPLDNEENNVQSMK